MAAINLLKLSERDQETLEAWLVEFDQTWHNDALAVWGADRLPQAGNSLRTLALAEMVKIDLERQWQHGRQVVVESYLDRYAELGTAETVAADLLLAEYQVRKQFGASTDAAEFARRFPAQAAELERLIQEEDASQAGGPSSVDQPPVTAAERDTSHASPTGDTVGPERVAEVRHGPPERIESRHRGSSGKSRKPLAGDVAQTEGGARNVSGEHTQDELSGAFGRYEIVKKLGQGGMGAVYLVHDTQLDRQVALKIPQFSPQDGPEAVERFLREARAAATLQHPNLCPVYDAGEIDGIHYMTMAYIEGHLLSEYMRTGKPQSERRAAALVRKLALALSEAHAHDIVHRDLKPTNIMINRRGEPIVMDFGLARRTQGDEAGLTQSGAVLGTPAYMAVEQAQGQTEAIGPRADVYSLGVILYELLTGRRPFRGEDVLQVLSKVLTAEPEPPSQHRSELDPRLEEICLKAMAKRPEDRFATMAELATALTRYLKADRRGSPAPAETSDRQVTDASCASTAAPASRSDEAKAEDHDETYGLSDALAGLTGFLMDPASLPSDEAPESADHQAGAGSSVRSDSLGTGEARGQEQDVSYVIPAPTAEQDVAIRPTPSLSDAKKRRIRTPRRRMSPRLWIAVGCGAAAILLLGVIFLLPTRHGLVKIELSDPNAEVDVKIDGETISITVLDKPLPLSPGPHTIVVTGDDFAPVKRSFTVKRGDRETMRVTLIPKVAKGPTTTAGSTSQAVGLVHTLTGSAYGFRCVALSPDGNHVLSASGKRGTSDAAVFLWDVQTGKLIHRLAAYTDRITSVAFSPDGSQGLSSGFDGTLRLWNLKDGTLIRRMEMKESGWYCHAEFTSDGSKAVVAHMGKELEKFDLVSGQRLRRFADMKMGGYPLHLRQIAFLPPGARWLVVSSQHDLTLQLWDTVTGREIRRDITFPSVGKPTVVNYAFSPDGQRAITLFQDGNVVLWELDTFRVVRQVKIEVPSASAIAVTSDGSLFLTGGAGKLPEARGLPFDCTVRVWGFESGKELHRFTNHLGAIRQLAVSRDGRLAASAGTDGVRIWRLPKE